MSNPIRVLVVDDSALARKILSDQLSRHPDIEVVGTAQDGSFVLSKIEQLHPDVVTLDVEMRTVGGLEVLPEIQQKFGIPVIMVSAHTDRGAEATIKAMEMGAVDFVTKPQALGMGSVEEIIELLKQKIMAVGRSRRRPLRSSDAVRTMGAATIQQRTPPFPQVAKVSGALRLDAIAIGASTGGTEAIKDVLVNLPDNLPGIVIVQHMPPGFTRAFANRLNTLCRVAVKEAEDGDEVMPGTALIAPGSHHMELSRFMGKLRVQLLESPPVNRHRPSVDVLFHSVAEKLGNRSLGIILTGMGGDGALGLKAIRDKGCVTVAQDEHSCVVFGMPKEAIKCGGAGHVLPLDDIAPFLVSQVAPARVIPGVSAIR